MERRVRYYYSLFSRLSVEDKLNLSTCKISPKSNCPQYLQNSWLKLPDGKRVLFKKYTSDSSFEENDFAEARMVNEILIAKLFEMCGVPAAQYKFALRGNELGVISFDLLGSGEELVSVEELWGSFNALLNANGDSKIKQGLDILLFKSIVVDLLTLQNDRVRYGRNLNVIKGRDGVLRMCPVIDSEYAYMLLDYLVFEERPYEIANGEVRTDRLFKSFLRNIDGIPILQVGHRTQRERIQDICELAASNPRFLKALNEVLRNLDLEKAYEQMKQEGIYVGKEYKHFTIELSDMAKDYIQAQLNAEMNRQL